MTLVDLGTGVTAGESADIEAESHEIVGRRRLQIRLGVLEGRFDLGSTGTAEEHIRLAFFGIEVHATDQFDLVLERQERIQVLRAGHVCLFPYGEQDDEGRALELRIFGRSQHGRTTESIVRTEGRVRAIEPAIDQTHLNGVLVEVVRRRSQLVRNHVRVALAQQRLLGTRVLAASGDEDAEVADLVGPGFEPAGFSPLRENVDEPTLIARGMRRVADDTNEEVEHAAAL